MTHNQHRERHVELHQKLDELLADFLTYNRGKVPSNTTVMELMSWSHQQTIEPVEGDPAPLSDRTFGGILEEVQNS